MISLLPPLFASAALACGGFFCSSGGSTTTTTTTTQTGDYGIVPVVQDGERILFRVNEDQSITTFVEVGFQQRDDVDFAWIIPTPEPIDVATVETASADLFNALELATAPTFAFQWSQQNVTTTRSPYGGFRTPVGCSAMGCSEASYKASTGDSGFSTFVTTSSVTEEASVAVLQDAVVGPFALEVITASDAAEFAIWLDANGYDLPEAAVAALEHYIDLGHAFLGVKLAPDVPSGPIETLVFTCPDDAPTIPLILTAIASADDLPITAYVLANQPYVPANWATTRDFSWETQPIGVGTTDYLARLQAETGVYDGQAFHLEFSGPTDALMIDDLIVNATVKQYPRLTRYRGEISPWEMTLDPWFAPFPGLQDRAREHDIWLSQRPPSVPSSPRARLNRHFRGQGAWMVLAPLALLGWSRRRAR